MLQFFRNFFSSKLGIAVTLGFLALIAFAFASADVSNTGGFGGVAGGDRVASVGKDRIDTSALSQAATSALENLRRDDPTVSMKAFIARGGLDSVLEQIIDRTAIGEFGRRHGIVAGDRLVDSEIAKIPAFQGPDGKFSQTAYRQAIAQQGISEKLIRADLAQGLVARQIMVPASFAAVLPADLARRYAGILRERREGAIALLPSAAFVSGKAPDDRDIAAFYVRKRDNYIRPERRVVRFAVFGDSVLKDIPAPTDAELQARYKANSALYAPSENRTFTQLIVPGEAAARDVLAGISGGRSMEAAASARGLAASKISRVSRQALAAQSSTALADAVFAASPGLIARPVRSPLGWHVIRLDTLERIPGRTFEQARPELVEQLTVLKRRAAINDLSARLEEEFDNGATLTDVVKELGLTMTITQPLTADGRNYANPDLAAPAVLGRALAAAFAMERENQPQVAEIEPGKVFIVFDVTNIQPSAPAPLAEIKGEVAAALLLERGATDARAAAERVLAATRKGTGLQAAMAALGIPLPPVDTVSLGREDLARQQNGVPPPVALLFSMAKGTQKLLKAPNDRGWYVVSLTQIVPGQLKADDPLITAAQRQLGATTGMEYAESLRRAIRAEVGVEKNPAAIKAVRNQLNGGS